MTKENIMKGVNSYSKQLTSEEISNEVHRNFVGGMWDEIGDLQFGFMVKNGLRMNSNLLDIGCGCLRGG